MKYIVQGNYRDFAVELTRQHGGEVSPFVPTDNDEVSISLNGACRYEFTDFQQAGNVLTFSDNGNLKVGLYQLEVKIVDAMSRRLRCMYREQVRVVASNDDIPQDASFADDEIVLNGTIYLGVAVIVDDQLSATSENPVQNKVVRGAIVNVSNALSSFAGDISPRVVSLESGMQSVSGDVDYLKGKEVNNITSSSDPDISLIHCNHYDNDTHTTTQLYTIGINGANANRAGVMSVADKTKLDGIESGATNDTTAIADLQANKQATLVSGTNIKTINNQSLLGSGNISISAPQVTIDNALSSTSTNPVQNKVVKAAIDNKLDEQYKLDRASIGTQSDKIRVTLENYEYGNPLTYFDLNAATSSVAGVMTAADKTKLDGIESGATNDTTAIANLQSGKQDALVSGTNIKTINGQSVLGSGDLNVGAQVTVDAALSPTSTNPVENRVVKNALDGKQATLTFDTTPTSGSTNPVTSGGVYAVLGDIETILDNINGN